MSMNSRKVWFWVAIGVAFFVFIFLIRSILLPFVAGIMIAYFLDPAADWLERKKLSRPMATSVLIIGFFSLLVLLMVALSPVLYDQFMGLMRVMPGYIEDLRNAFGPQIQGLIDSFATQENAEEAKEAMSKASGTIFEVAQEFVKSIFASGMAVVNLITLLFLTPVVAFYLLRDYDNIVSQMDRLLPRDNADTIREQVRLMDNTISGYLRGQVNVCLILAVYYAVVLSLAGLKYGILVGIVAGLISFIPFVGALVGFVVATLIAVFQFDEFYRVIIVMAVYGFGQFLEGNILVPKLIGDKVGLHPAWVIFGMLAGGALLGFVGVLLAVPISAIIGVLVRFSIEQYRKSPMYQGDDEYQPRPPKRRVIAKKKAAPPTTRAT